MAENEAKFNVVFSTTLLERLANDTPSGRERREQQRRDQEQRRRQEAARAAAQRPIAREPDNPSPSNPSTRNQWQEGRYPSQGPQLGLPGGVPPGMPGFLHFGKQAGGSNRHEGVEEPPPKDLGPIRKALAESEHVGALLLKREEDELHKVKELAQRLHEQEYRAPSRSPPCTAQRDECIRCYSENKQDPLRCAALVETFTRCSREAQQAFVESSSRAQTTQR